LVVDALSSDAQVVVQQFQIVHYFAPAGLIWGHCSG
jgi:hypothetical protein